MADDVATRKTYRYVRLGMIAAVFLLAASVILERVKVAGCWQPSISAYYYTPVRAVFVGTLLAIGLSLIVIKGSTGREDMCLNVAGMLAPVVALVPTSDHGTCWSIVPRELPTVPNASGDDPLADWVIANIHNNIEALIFAGLAGLALALITSGVLFRVGRRNGEYLTVKQFVKKEENRGTAVGLMSALVLLGAGALAYYHWGGFETKAHGIAAGAMFAALALAAGFNALDCYRLQRRCYFWLYLTVALLMAVSALPLLVDWEHKVLAVEIAEITWFAAFWLMQTGELWNDTVRRAPPGVSRR